MLSQRTPQGAIRFPIRDSIDVSIAVSKTIKRPWMDLASELERALISTIISELGTNIVKYADYGRITVEFKDDKDIPRVIIWAQDEGPGIADIGMAMKDHYTTGNTLGLGLPGVKRMADDFAISSAPGEGTQVMAIKGLGGIAKGTDLAFRGLSVSKDKKTANEDASIRWDMGSYTRPLPGQIRGGDIAITLQHAAGLLMVMVDVTGHGERAFEIGKKIEALVLAQPELPASELMMLLHNRIRGTIGAAIGILKVDPNLARFAYLGVGNTGIARVTGERWRGVSRDGLVGSRLPGLRQVDGVLSAGDAFLMWTDGIPEIDGPKYLKQHQEEPAGRVASQLVSSLGKPYDDAGCIVFRWLK